MRTRVVFEVTGLGRTVMRAFEIRPDGSMDDASNYFEQLVVRAAKSEGCRSFTVGVHLGGADCDHKATP